MTYVQTIMSLNEVIFRLHAVMSLHAVSTTNEEDILLLQDMYNTLLACEMDADYAFVDNKEEEDGGGHCNELLDELELREASILRRMAKKCADLTTLREKMRHLGRTIKVEGSDRSARHWQSKLKNLRQSLKKSDELHMSVGGHCSWVEVEVGCSTRQRRTDW